MPAFEQTSAYYARFAYAIKCAVGVPIAMAAVWLGLCLYAPAAAAIQFQAETFTHDQANNEIHAQGQVLIVFDEGRLYADEVWIDLENEIVRGRGQVVLEGQDGLTIEAASLEYNLRENTGTFEDFYITIKDVEATGEVLKRLGPDRYEITNGAYSTCRGYCKDWAVEGAKIYITVEGYAWIHSAVFRAGGVPVMYLPVAVIPVKTRRQTGFLFPYVGYLSTVGTLWSFPFFLNLSPHTDMTFYPTYYVKRGWGLELEHRYMLARYWSGIMNIDAIYERHDRTWLFGFRTEHMAFFEDAGLATVLHGTRVSSYRYFNEYMRASKYMGASGLPIELAGHAGPQWGDMSAQFMLIDDILPRQRLIPKRTMFVAPQIRFQSALWKPADWLGAAASAQFAYMSRFDRQWYDSIPEAPDIIYDASGRVTRAEDTTPGLDDNDVIVGLIQMGVKPDIWMRPAISDYLSWEMHLSNPLLYYRLPAGRDALTFVPEIENAFWLRFENVFPMDSGDAVQHSITPTLTHTYRPKIFRYGYVRFFEPPTRGLDPVEALVANHFALFELNNRIMIRERGAYRTLATLTLGGSVHTDWGVSLAPGQTIRRFGPLTSSTALYFPTLSLYLTTKTDVNNDFLTDVSGTAVYQPMNWLYLSNQVALIGPANNRHTQMNGTLRFLNIARLFSLSTSLKYSFTDRQVLWQQYALDVAPQSQCWMASLVFDKSVSDDVFSFLVFFSINFGEMFGGMRGFSRDETGSVFWR